MLPRYFNTPFIVLTLLTAFSRQQGSAERLAAPPTVGVLPSSSFVTAIFRQTTGIQRTAEASASSSSSSSLPTLASVSVSVSVPPPDPSSSRLALSSSSRSVVVNDEKKGKAKEVVEKSATTKEVAPILPKRGYRARKPGIWAQCDSYYAIAMWVVRIDQMKEWHVPDDQIETNMRTELKRHCGRGTTGWRYLPPTDDGRGADIRFLTSLLVHHDCVEKAIVAAGGPPVKCRSGKPRPWQGPAAPYIPVIDGPVTVSSETTTSPTTPTPLTATTTSPS